MKGLKTGLLGALLISMSNQGASVINDQWQFRDCLVPGSRINVRYALKPQMVSAPRMHDLFTSAITYIYTKIVEDSPYQDRPLLPDELPFDFDGTGAAKWYYVDIEPTAAGILTWQNLHHTFKGLLLCAYYPHQYRAIHFEVWETTRSGDRSTRIGIGDFGTKTQAAVQ
ncbi:MAG: hypothetical protein Q9170_001337 [Blastenia crenularia]